MLTTLLMVGPFILFAWGVQFFLNQLIADDIETLNAAQPMDDVSIT